MKFCSNCGESVVLRTPEGDNRERFICDHCHTIHYQNPNIVAGCIPEWQGRILLCKRAIEPRYGLWTLPAGFMENGETTEQAAMRETPRHRPLRRLGPRRPRTRAPRHDRRRHRDRRAPPAAELGDCPRIGTFTLRRSLNELLRCGEVPCSVDYGASAAPCISPNARQIANAPMLGQPPNSGSAQPVAAGSRPSWQAPGRPLGPPPHRRSCRWLPGRPR